MNERMKDLVGQAKFMAEESINKQISANAELNAFAEKFAELLIKECADVCLRQSRSGWNDDRKAQARLDYDLIKEHFGVKK